MLNKMLIALLTSAATLALASMAHAADPTCEPAKVAEKYPSIAGKTIKVGADPQTPPYVMRDAKEFDKIVGVDASLAKAVFDCVGVKHDFILGAWSGILPAVQAGQIDVMWDDLYYKPERAKVVDFVVYMQAATGALVPAGNPKKISSVADLCGLTVSFGLGSSNEIAVKKQDEACKASGESPITAMPFQDLAAGIRLLEGGRADAIMWDLGFVDNLAATRSGSFSRAFAVMDGFKIGAAVANGNKDLLNAITDGLTAVQTSGEAKKIFQTYGVDPGLELKAHILTD